MTIITEKTETKYLWAGEIGQDDDAPIGFHFYGTQMELADYVYRRMRPYATLDSTKTVYMVHYWFNNYLNYGELGMNDSLTFMNTVDGAVTYYLNYLSYAELTEITNIPHLISDYQSLTGDSHETNE